MMSQPKLLQAVGLLDLGLLEQTLKENPKSIHDHDEDGATALILAAEAGQFTMVSTLIGARSDVNAQTKDGCSVLMWAARSGSTRCVRELLEAGADTDARDNNGKTAADHASKPTVVELLRSFEEEEEVDIGDDEDADERRHSIAPTNQFTEEDLVRFENGGIFLDVLGVHAFPQLGAAKFAYTGFVFINIVLWMVRVSAFSRSGEKASTLNDKSLALVFSTSLLCFFELVYLLYRGNASDSLLSRVIRFSITFADDRMRHYHFIHRQVKFLTNLCVPLSVLLWLLWNAEGIFLAISGGDVTSANTLSYSSDKYLYDTFGAGFLIWHALASAYMFGMPYGLAYMFVLAYNMLRRTIKLVLEDHSSVHTRNIGGDVGHFAPGTSSSTDVRSNSKRGSWLKRGSGVGVHARKALTDERVETLKTIHKFEERLRQLVLRSLGVFLGLAFLTLVAIIVDIQQNNLPDWLDFLYPAFLLLAVCVLVAEVFRVLRFKNSANKHMVKEQKISTRAAVVGVEDDEKMEENDTFLIGLQTADSTLNLGVEEQKEQPARAKKKQKRESVTGMDMLRIHTVVVVKDGRKEYVRDVVNWGGVKNAFKWVLIGGLAIVSVLLAMMFIRLIFGFPYCDQVGQSAADNFQYGGGGIENSIDSCPTIVTVFYLINRFFSSIFALFQSYAWVYFMFGRDRLRELSPRLERYTLIFGGLGMLCQFYEAAYLGARYVFGLGLAVYTGWSIGRHPSIAQHNAHFTRNFILLFLSLAVSVVGLNGFQVPLFVRSDDINTRLFVVLVTHALWAVIWTAIANELASKFRVLEPEINYPLWAIIRTAVSMYSRIFVINVGTADAQVFPVVIFSLFEVCQRATHMGAKFLSGYIIGCGDVKKAYAKMARSRTSDKEVHQIWMKMAIEYVAIIFATVTTIVVRANRDLDGFLASDQSIIFSFIAQLAAEVIVDMASMLLESLFMDRHDIFDVWKVHYHDYLKVVTWAGASVVALFLGDFVWIVALAPTS